MQIPRVLTEGDAVAVIAPSSPIILENLPEVEAGIKSFGLIPKLFPSCYERHGHFAGSDALRLKDIHDAFADPDIKGILCLRGGYGTPRLLPYLDYAAIATTPKVFLGYSDITGLHCALNRLSKLVTFHGPMPSGDGFHKKKAPYAWDHLRRAMMCTAPLGIYEPPNGEPLITVKGGSAVGQLIGGNLSLLETAAGSPYGLDARDKILFIEEVSEPHYVIDRMLTSLALHGILDACAGVILGTWNDCKAEHGSQNKIDLPLETVFEEIFAPYAIPIVNNFRAGHVSEQFTLPFGTRVRLDATRGEVEFLESATRAV